MGGVSQVVLGRGQLQYRYTRGDGERCERKMEEKRQESGGGGKGNERIEGQTGQFIADH